MRQVALCAAITAGVASMAHAQIGDPVIASGGNVIITVLPSTAGYTSSLYLMTGEVATFLATNRDLGTTIDLGVFAAGTELIFRLDTPENYSYFTGAAERNPDGLAHARVDAYSGYSIVGFEDLYNGGDLDYDDCTFRFENVVPAPGAAALAVPAMIFAARRRRR